MLVTSLGNGDDRSYTANVANPAALLVAKLHKLGERQAMPGRLVDKDAHDLHRLRVATQSRRHRPVAATTPTDPLAGPTTDQGLHYLADSVMAGRAEEGIGKTAVSTSR